MTSSTTAPKASLEFIKPVLVSITSRLGTQGIAKILQRERLMEFGTGEVVR